MPGEEMEMGWVKYIIFPQRWIVAQFTHRILELVGRALCDTEKSRLDSESSITSTYIVFPSAQPKLKWMVGLSPPSLQCRGAFF